MSRKVLIVVGFLLFASVAANACPYCAYSPNNWGFCRYGANIAYYDCKEYVADSWTGRTACSLCGYCNGYHPEESIACVAGGGGNGDCGLTSPCDQTSKAPDLPVPSCGRPSRITNGNDLNWIDARVDQVVIF